MTARPSQVAGDVRTHEVYAIVSRIPRGRVVTYGQIAELAGFRGRARQVGYALAALAEGVEIPWHRVINARGAVSPRSNTKVHEFQRHLLESEGIEFVNDRVNLERVRWRPAAGDLSDSDPRSGKSA